MKIEKKKPKPCLLGLVLILLLLMVVELAGCSSGEMLFGSGVAAGTALQGTITGAKQDIEAYKASLQEQYAKAVAEGAPQETLDRIELSLRRAETTEEVVALGESAANTDWSDPEAVGGWVGFLASALVAGLLKKKLGTTTAKYDAHKAGVDKTIRETAPKVAEVNLGETLYNNIGIERAKLGI